MGKEYKCRVPLISPYILVVIALSLMVMAMLFCVTRGRESNGFIICIGLFIAFTVAYLFDALSVAHKYSYTDNAIQISFMGIVYKTIQYQDFSYIVISNASYNNGHGYGLNANYAMHYTKTTKTSREKFVFPYISFHKGRDSVEEITIGATSRDLYFIQGDDMACVGICWVDSFNELLRHTKLNVYILEDVYLRFRDNFDRSISVDSNFNTRCFIIAGQIVRFNDYQEA